MGFNLDVNFFKPFISGALETLSVQCNLNAKASRPVMKKDLDQLKYKIAIAGVIGVKSSTFTGNITLCFPKAVFLKLMSNMLGEDVTEIDAEIADGCGELLNIIYGQAKAVLNNSGYDLEKAIPSIITGEGVTTHHLTMGDVIVLPFTTEAGDFLIEISTEDNANMSNVD